MPARLAIWLTVTSSEPVRPISFIVALTSAARRIGSIPNFGILRPFFTHPERRKDFLLTRQSTTRMIAAQLLVPLSALLA